MSVFVIRISLVFALLQIKLKKLEIEDKKQLIKSCLQALHRSNFRLHWSSHWIDLDVDRR